MYTKFLKFLPTANAAKSYSKDPSTQVGAIAIDDDYNIRAQGYNGFPRGVHDTEERLNDRTKKYPRTVHAEANLVAMAARTGVSLQGCSVLLTSLHPCSTCAGLLIQAGVKRIFTPEQVENARWDESGEIALEMFQEAGVEVVPYASEKKPETPFEGLQVKAIELAGGVIPYWTGTGLTGPLLIDQIHKELDKRTFSDDKQSEFLQKCEWEGKDYIRYGSRVGRSRTVQWGEWVIASSNLKVLELYPFKVDLGWESYRD